MTDLWTLLEVTSPASIPLPLTDEGRAEARRRRTLLRDTLDQLPRNMNIVGDWYRWYLRRGISQLGPYCAELSERPTKERRTIYICPNCGSNTGLDNDYFPIRCTSCGCEYQREGLGPKQEIEVAALAAQPVPDSGERMSDRQVIREYLAAWNDASWTKPDDEDYVTKVADHMAHFRSTYSSDDYPSPIHGQDDIGACAYCDALRCLSQPVPDSGENDG
jgi:hypothetical protein